MMEDFIISDSTTQAMLVPPPGFGTGLELPIGFSRNYEGVAEPFPDSLVIAESEWSDRINERIKQRMLVKDRLLAAKIPVKNQQSTNYCWVNAPTFCVEIMRFFQFQPYVSLSPASAGAPIKNYRNVGGWGKEALEWISENGLLPSDVWPDNAINRKYNTEENNKKRVAYKAHEWWVLEERSNAQVISAILLGFPVALGFNWWGHEVTGVDVVLKDGKPALLIGNSWGASWGDQGYGLIVGRKMLADDAVCPRTVSAG